MHFDVEAYEILQMLQEQQVAFLCMFLQGNVFSVQLARRFELYDGVVWSEPLSLSVMFGKH